MPPKLIGLRNRTGSQSADKDVEPEAWKCNTCKKDFNNASDKIVQCEYCNNYYCCKCLGLTTSEYQSFKTPALHWFCPSCEEKVIKNLRTDRDIEQRCAAFMERMEERVKTLEIQIEKKTDIEKVEEIVNEAIGKVGKSESPENLVSIEETVEKKVSEIRESTLREKNIIIHGAKEVDNKDPKIRKEVDTDYVHNLTNFLDSDEKAVKSVIRIGKRTEMAGAKNKNDEQSETLEASGNQIKTRPRPMKVSFSNTEAKVNFMKNLNKLREIDDSSQFHGISVAHDMTKAERDHNKELTGEARQRNENDKSGKYRHIVRGPPWARKVIKVRLKEN